jgi:hypothetical protein
MKRTVFLALAFVAFFSCKKEEKPEPAPEPAPVQTGTILLKIQAYDSLGDPMADNGGLRVKLDPVRSATTDASGMVSFTDVKYDSYFPTVLRDTWETPPTMVTLGASSVTAGFPVAQRSQFRAQNFTAQIVKKDSITVSFILDKTIPPFKSAKIALIASKSALTPSNYSSLDIFYANTTAITKFNVANFPKFKGFVASLDSSATFYINVIPVSYGEYLSNIVAKPLLLGENLFLPDNWLLKKEWK